MWPVKGGAEAKKSFLNSFKEAGERSVGARGRLKYEPASYHGRVGNPLKSKGPINGQQALDNSVRVSENAPRRVGIDYETGEFVIFDQTSEGVFHGHVRPWEELRQQDQSILSVTSQSNEPSLFPDE